MSFFLYLHAQPLARIFLLMGSKSGASALPGCYTRAHSPFFADGLLEAIGDAPAVEVVDGKLHRDLIPRKNLDVVHAHLA